MLHHVQFLYCSRSFFFSSLINSLAPSHRPAVCLLSCSCAQFLLLSRCLIYPARFWKASNVAVRTHIPYSPTPVRSASISSGAGSFFALFSVALPAWKQCIFVSVMSQPSQYSTAKCSKLSNSILNNSLGMLSSPHAFPLDIWWKAVETSKSVIGLMNV